MEVKFPLPTHPWEIKAAKDYNGQGLLEQLNMKENVNQLRNLIFVSIISADNDEFDLTEDQKQEIIQRHKMNMSWESILEPIPDEGKRNKLIEFFEQSEVD